VTDAPRSRGRRALTFGAAAAVLAAAYGAGPALRAVLPQRFEFEPLPDLPGFRRLASGDTSGAIDPLAGIAAGPRPPEADAEALRADLCSALFGGPAPAGVVPVAYFTDVSCAFCRVLSPRLAAVAAEGGVRVTRHEWPLFGERSELAARAAIAAEAQGVGDAFHAALMRGGFVPTPAFLDTLAGRVGADPARLRADMAASATDAAVARARGLARLFGFPGTPGLVVGRTALAGAIDEARLAALIDRERADGQPPACG
jgi:protein-disulfide isomerase